MSRMNTKPSKRVKNTQSAPKAEDVVPAKRHKRLSLPSGKSEKFYKQWISRERSLLNKERDAHEMTKNMLALANMRASEYQKNFLALNVIIADVAITAIANPQELQSRADSLQVNLKKFLKK